MIHEYLPQGDVLPRLRRLVARLSLWRPGLFSRRVHVIFLLDKVELGQVSVRVFRYFGTYHFARASYLNLSTTDTF
jgi:hypothetical protein